MAHLGGGLLDVVERLNRGVPDLLNELLPMLPNGGLDGVTRSLLQLEPDVLQLHPLVLESFHRRDRSCLKLRTPASASFFNSNAACTAHSVSCASSSS